MKDTNEVKKQRPFTVVKGRYVIGTVYATSKQEAERIMAAAHKATRNLHHTT